MSCSYLVVKNHIDCKLLAWCAYNRHMFVSGLTLIYSYSTCFCENPPYTVRGKIASCMTELCCSSDTEVSDPELRLLVGIVLLTQGQLLQYSKLYYTCMLDRPIWVISSDTVGKQRQVEDHCRIVFWYYWLCAPTNRVYMPLAGHGGCEWKMYWGDWDKDDLKVYLTAMYVRVLFTASPIIMSEEA